MSDPVSAFMAAANQPDIICDTDDTIAFEAEELCSVLNAHFGLSLELATLTDYHPLQLPKGQGMNKFLKQWRQNPLCYINHAPDYEAIGGVTALHDAGFDITLASDRPVEMMTITTNWYQQWGVPYDAVFVNGDGSKAALTAMHNPANPCILIDDDPRNASLARPGVQVWLPFRPWTPPNLAGPYTWVFHSWADVLARLGL